MKKPDSGKSKTRRVDNPKKVGNEKELKPTLSNREAFTFIHQDENIIAVNKAPGISTIPERYVRDGRTVSELLTKQFGKIFIVHRLDKDTSGIVVFARNAETHRELSMLFEDRQVRKIYRAVVQGIFGADPIEINIPLLLSNTRSKLVVPSARGKEAITKVRLVEGFKSASLVECNLITGRQHQIRAHLSASGFPLIGDADYGGTGEFFLSSIKRKYVGEKADEKPIIARVALHSFSLEFTVPSSGIHYAFQADYPRDFSALLSVLGKYSKLKKFG